MVLSQQTQNTSNPDSMFESQAIDSSCSSNTSGLVTPISDNGMQHTLPAACPVPALLVTNLPSVLFSQVADLHPLLCPFGEIVTLKIVSKKHEEETVSVFVEYKTALQAKEAFEALCGQRYTSKPVNVEFVQPSMPSMAESNSDNWISNKFNSRTGLNPLAAPFLAEHANPVNTPVASMPYSSSSLSRNHKISVANIVTRTNSPFFEAPIIQSSASDTVGVYGMPFFTHRPRSAPSKCVRSFVSIITLTPSCSPTGLHPGNFPGSLGCSARNLAPFASTSLRSSFTA